jgi:5-methylcytosine-specific restriction endonuclease McrA
MKQSIREPIRIRANDCCEYCQAQAYFSHDSFSVEHIIPIMRNGSDDLSNLAWSCLSCNNIKNIFVTSLDPETGQIVPLFHPREDLWEEHFEWSEDTTLMIGKTPVGRATIFRLQLNRFGLINYRRVLAAVGEHPPKKS